MAMRTVPSAAHWDNVGRAAPGCRPPQPASVSLVYLRTVCDYDQCVRYKIRFLWNATRGHRLAPWRSPYLLWRIETYTGVKMTQIGFVEFWEFMWRERRDLWRFLKWTAEMERYVHPKPKSS
jgi:hypothetical protein